MRSTQTFRELTYTMWPQDPRGDGSFVYVSVDRRGAIKSRVCPEYPNPIAFQVIPP
jgi:hypothetical protein